MSVTTRGRPEPLQSKLLLSYSSATCHRLWVEVLKSKANTQEVCLLHWMDQRRISAIWHWRQSGQKFLWSLQRELNRPSSVLAFFSHICVLNFNTAVKEIKKNHLKKTTNKLCQLGIQMSETKESLGRRWVCCGQWLCQTANDITACAVSITIFQSGITVMTDSIPKLPGSSWHRC